MRIGIISAMEIEQVSLLKQIDQVGVSTHEYGMNTVRVEAFGHSLFCVLAGVGKVHAALSAAALLQVHQCDVILNSGVAGGISKPIGTIVLSSAVAYHDVDVTNIGNYALGQLPGMPLCFEADAALLKKSEAIAEAEGLAYTTGLIATGDQFVTRKAMIETFMQAHPDLEAIDMEAAAIAHAAYQAKVPYLVIRSISDTIDTHNQQADYETFFKDAAHNAARLMVRLVQSL